MNDLVEFLNQRIDALEKRIKQLEENGNNQKYLR